MGRSRLFSVVGTNVECAVFIAVERSVFRPGNVAGIRVDFQRPPLKIRRVGHHEILRSGMAGIRFTPLVRNPPQKGREAGWIVR